MDKINFTDYQLIRLNENYEINLCFQEWYTVIDKEGKSKERYLFLFKARILVCKVRRISEDRSVFVLKDIIRVREYISIISQLYCEGIQSSKFHYFVLVTRSRSKGSSR